MPSWLHDLTDPIDTDSKEPEYLIGYSYVYRLAFNSLWEHRFAKGVSEEVAELLTSKFLDGVAMQLRDRGCEPEPISMFCDGFRKAAKQIEVITTGG